MSNQAEKIHELLCDFDTAMLITLNENGRVHGRPMAIARVEPDCGVWFFTGRDSPKAHEIEGHQQVLIVCQHEHTRYVSLNGTAELIRDPGTARELWKESFKTWFPQGIEDPNLLLIHVRPEQAEYWDTQGFKGVQYFFEAAKAYFSGTTPRIREGEQHGTVSLQ